MGLYSLQATFEPSLTLGAERVQRRGLISRSDGLDSVGELYTEDDFRQLIVTVDTTPSFLGSLSELEALKLMASAV